MSRGNNSTTPASSLKIIVYCSSGKEDYICMLRSGRSAGSYENESVQ
jgi:hypothetical protein